MSIALSNFLITSRSWLRASLLLATREASTSRIGNFDVNVGLRAKFRAANPLRWGGAAPARLDGAHGAGTAGFFGSALAIAAAIAATTAEGK